MDNLEDFRARLIDISKKYPGERTPVIAEAVENHLSSSWTCDEPETKRAISLRFLLTDTRGKMSYESVHKAATDEAVGMQFVGGLFFFEISGEIWINGTYVYITSNY